MTGWGVDQKCGTLEGVRGWDIAERDQGTEDERGGEGGGDRDRHRQGAIRVAQSIRALESVREPSPSSASSYIPSLSLSRSDTKTRDFASPAGEGEGRSVYAEGGGDPWEREGGGQRERQRGLPPVREKAAVREKSLPRRGGGGWGRGGMCDRGGGWGGTQQPSAAYSVGRYESAGVRGRPGICIYILAILLLYYYLSLLFLFRRSLRERGSSWEARSRECRGRVAQGGGADRVDWGERREAEGGWEGARNNAKRCIFAWESRGTSRFVEEVGQGV